MSQGIADATDVPPAAPASRRINRGGRPRKDGSPAQPKETRAQTRHVDAEFLDEEGKPFTRRVEVGGNDFDIPVHLKKKGWDYCYWPARIQGQPVDAADNVRIRGGGWRPVKVEEMPELVPAGWDKTYIERGAQILYKRPMYLTQESRREDLKRAEDQKYDKLKGALAGPQELGKIAPRKTLEIDMHGAIGTTHEKMDG